MCGLGDHDRTVWHISQEKGLEHAVDVLLSRVDVTCLCVHGEDGSERKGLESEGFEAAPVQRARCQLSLSRFSCASAMVLPNACLATFSHAFVLGPSPSGIRAPR